MRRRTFPIYLFFLLLATRSIAQLPPLGQWREHLSWNQALWVAASPDGIYCASPWALFRVDDGDNSIDRFSKVNGLHETGIRVMARDAQENKLVIAYNNSNIDIIAGNSIVNIDALMKKEIAGDKNVYNIFCSGGYAYLADGLGIIVVDEGRYEIKDTWVIGQTGGNTRVNGMTTDAAFFYAATAEGLKRAPATGLNLADYRNWQPMSGSAGLATGECRDVVNLQSTIIALKGDSLFGWNGSSWGLLYTSAWTINNITVSDSRLVLSQQQGGKGRVLLMDKSGTVLQTIAQDPLASPRQAVVSAGIVWAADSIAGLLRISGGSVERYRPNSPLSVATGQLSTGGRQLWAASGAVSSSWTNTFTRNGLYRFSEEQWTNYSGAGFDSLYDIVVTAVDPVDYSGWAGSFGGGLVHVKNDRSLEIFKQQSPLPPAAADATKYYIAGLAFDAGRNLWISSYGAARSLSVRKADGSWRSFSFPFSIAGNATGQLLPDDYNQVWVVSPGGNGLLCFNYGPSIDNPADDKWKWYQAGKGNGNLPSGNVLCLAKDKNGYIWVGTDKGIGVIQCTQDVFSVQGCEAVLPVVQQDNFAGYLFSAEQVQSIAVDGADRKWVGTKNGVWLLSDDGQKTLWRFTTDNSPLPANDVRSIAIDGKTGEVFFATVNGICSFRADATTGGSSNEDVLVFPNPVPPGYNGSIAIRGLVDNAIVKITELNGRLVYETRALGGQAVWNGRDYSGRTVTTGIYLVLVSDDARKQKTATKIVFIGR
ncbi:MAG: hypothetical protein JST39_06345 [Bacteroidetes bacterium]|nr:hypothetical protein [Bacteroidota bacterium]